MGGGGGGGGQKMEKRASSCVELRPVHPYTQGLLLGVSERGGGGSDLIKTTNPSSLFI